MLHFGAMAAYGDARGPAPTRRPFHPESLLGTTLDGRYRISSHLASGGMGAVFRAEHVYMRKDVALKVLRPDLSASPDLAERFRRESEIAASLDHENIVRVTDFGRSPEGYLFLAMELLEGESLFERLRRAGALAPEQVVPILLQVCAGLEAAHRRGVVHRDLKPENIFLDSSSGKSPVVKILDFGIAQISEQAGVGAADAGMVVGTPEYLSPEQAFGKEVDSRSDIYAVGLIAWRMLAGRHPFQAESPRALVYKQANVPVPPLGKARPELHAYPALLATVARACAKDPSDRPQSAAELSSELSRRTLLVAPAPSAPAAQAEEVAVGESVTISLPTPLPLLAGPRPRRPWLWLLAGAVAVALLAAALLVPGTRPASRVEGLLGRGRVEQARDLALAALEEHPSDARLRVLLGRAQERLGEPAAAFASLEAAAQLDPGALDGEAVDAVAASLASDHGEGEEAARVLSSIGPRAVPALLAVLPRTSGARRLRTLQLLRTFGAENRVDLVASFAPLLADPDCELRLAAVRRLAANGDPSAIPYLEVLAHRREERGDRSAPAPARAAPACGAGEAEEALSRLRAAARRR